MPNGISRIPQGITIRKPGLDKQVDAVAFARFVTAFSDIDGFSAMPWGERANVLKERCGVGVDERTLRSWFSKLIKNEIAMKGEEISYWRTDVIDKVKIRMPATKRWIFIAFNDDTETLREIYELVAEIASPLSPNPQTFS